MCQRWKGWFHSPLFTGFKAYQLRKKLLTVEEIKVQHTNTGAKQTDVVNNSYMGSQGHKHK